MRQTQGNARISPAQAVRAADAPQHAAAVGDSEIGDTGNLDIKLTIRRGGEVFCAAEQFEVVFQAVELTP